MTEKKNDDYEKPESLGEDEDLENVRGGGEVGLDFPACKDGGSPVAGCSRGVKGTGSCKSGPNYY
jgi:hypothetical protein